MGPNHPRPGPILTVASPGPLSSGTPHSANQWIAIHRADGQYPQPIIPTYTAVSWNLTFASVSKLLPTEVFFIGLLGPLTYLHFLAKRARSYPLI